MGLPSRTAGSSVILGLSMLTVTHLKAEHLWLGWLPGLRITLLGAGCIGSLVLVAGLLRQSAISRLRQLIAGLAMVWPVALMAAIWTLVFFVW